MAICVFAKRKTLLNYKHGGEGGLQEERGEKTLILSEVLLSLNGCCRPVQAAGALGVCTLILSAVTLHKPDVYPPLSQCGCEALLCSVDTPSSVFLRELCRRSTKPGCLFLND